MPPEPAFWQCPKCKTPNPWAGYLTNCVACGRPRPPAELREVLAPRPEPGPESPAPRPARVLSALTWLYAATVVVALAMIKLLGERWWPATVLLFGPRWLFLAPLPLIVPWGLWRRRYGLVGIQAAAGAVVLGPMMGLCLPVGSLFRARPGGSTVRVLSLNRGEHGLDARAVTDLVADRKIDVICLQEVRPDAVLDAYFAAPRWHRSKQGTILSRFPIVEEWPPLADVHEPPDFYSVKVARVRLRLPEGGEVLVASVHMPTMTRGLVRLEKGDFAGMQSHSDWRMRQMERVLVAMSIAPATPAIVAGDFNTPPDSPVMRPILATFPSGFEAVGWGYGYTRPSRLTWAGIDRILAGRGAHFLSCHVGPRVGSDHRPIYAEVAVPPAGMP